MTHDFYVIRRLAHCFSDIYALPDGCCATSASSMIKYHHIFVLRRSRSHLGALGSGGRRGTRPPPPPPAPNLGAPPPDSSAPPVLALCATWSLSDVDVTRLIAGTAGAGSSSPSGVFSRGVTARGALVCPSGGSEPPGNPPRAPSAARLAADAAPAHCGCVNPAFPASHPRAPN